MSDNSHIEWTDATWNPTTGCTKVSEGCRHCYIDRTPAFRIGSKPKNGVEIPPRRFDSEEIGGTTGVMMHPERLDQPLRWRRPRRIFVNSLSDLFHDDITDEFIADVFGVMQIAGQHIFQVLTKRPRRMQALLSADWWPDFVRDRMVDAAWFDSEVPVLAAGIPPNVWLGTSVEDQKAADLRIPLLLETPAAVRFLSCEPLLGPVTLPLIEDVDGCTCAGGGIEVGGCHEPHCGTEPGIAWNRLHWVIVGGESGPKARPMHPEWARSLRDQCVAADVPFFFKQWGNWTPDWPDGNKAAPVALLPDGAPTTHWSHPRAELLRNVGKKKAGRELDGRTWDEMPELMPA